MKNIFFNSAVISMIFSIILFSGCSNKKNNISKPSENVTQSAKIIEPQKENEITPIEEETVQKVNFPNYLYVNSPDGLRIHKKPSLESDYISSVQYCSQLKVVALGEKVTIDNIEDNWVKVLLPCLEWKTESKEYGWVFGGYLQEEKPPFSIETENGLIEYMQSAWLHEIVPGVYYVYCFSGPEDDFSFMCGKEGTSDCATGTWKAEGIDKIKVSSEFWYQDGDDYKVTDKKENSLTIEILNEYEIIIDGKKCFRTSPDLLYKQISGYDKINSYKKYIFQTFKDNRNFFQLMKDYTQNWTYGNFNREEVIRTLIKYGLYDDEYSEQYNNYWN